MSVITFKSYLTPNIIDSWDKQISFLTPRVGGILNKGVDESIRKCEARAIIPSQNLKLYIDVSSNILPVIDATMDVFKCNIYRTLEIQHATYSIGDFYRPHTDISSPMIEEQRNSQRKISMVVMMSDPADYSGGELIVNGKQIPNEKGTIVLFSPVLRHEVKKVTSGVRKTLVIWALGPHFK